MRKEVSANDLDRRAVRSTTWLMAAIVHSRLLPNTLHSAIITGHEVRWGEPERATQTPPNLKQLCSMIISPPASTLLPPLSPHPPHHFLLFPVLLLFSVLQRKILASYSLANHLFPHLPAPMAYLPACFMVLSTPSPSRSLSYSIPLSRLVPSPLVGNHP